MTTHGYSGRLIYIEVSRMPVRDYIIITIVGTFDLIAAGFSDINQSIPVYFDVG